jgi:hypothetical protein
MAVGDFFLTAFDPSDLPATSIDPLGFDRGYTFLADKILPGLTNVANRPRYFGMLCAGVALAEVDEGDPPKKLYNDRREAVLRLERLWALANVLAAGESRPASGVRGIHYVSEEVARLQRAGMKSATARFKLLSRQEPYGALGIYGAIAEGLRLIVERRTFTLSPDAGDALAAAFIEETAMPPAVKRAVRDDTEVTTSVLAAWGERAHISASPGKEESRHLDEALHRNPVRSRTARRLSSVPSEKDESELARIKRIHKSISDDSTDADLKDALEAILGFEECYRASMLGFERLLWLCRSATNAVLPREHLRRDKVIGNVCELLPRAAQRFNRAFEKRRTDHLVAGIERIEDARRFIDRAAAACDTPWLLCDEVLVRHADVQHGKFDRGRRKMPWIESGAAGLALTSTRTGGLSFEAKSLDEISPHPYRLAAADALLVAAAAA